MKIRPASPDDRPVILRHLGRITQLAQKTYLQAEAEGRVIECLVCEGDGNRGVFCTLIQPDRVLLNASFLTDPDDQSIFELFDRRLLEVHAAYREWKICFNTRGDHLSLTRYKKEHGFHLDDTGYEFSCSTVDARKPASLLLHTRPFEKKFLAETLELLDMAFNPLLIENHLAANMFRREPEKWLQKFLEKDRNGDMVTFWNKDRLAGIYYLAGNVIDAIAVHPDFQNLGCGTEILAHAAKKMLSEKGFTEIDLYVMASNQGARRFYARNGWAETGCYEESSYVGGHNP